MSDLSCLLLEAIQYEHWLRFYFLDDSDNSKSPDGSDKLVDSTAYCSDAHCAGASSGMAEGAAEAVAEADAVWNPALLTATLRVPQAWVQASRLGEPHLFPLLETLRDQPISLETSRDAVFRHVALALGEKADEPGFGEMLFQLLGNPQFRRGLDSFHGWVQELANGDENPSFDSNSEQGGQAGTPSTAPDKTPEGKCAGTVEPGIPSFAAWRAEFERWAQRESVKHVASISPFGAKVQYGSGEDKLAPAGAKKEL